jgi:hypothetical protein
MKKQYWTRHFFLQIKKRYRSVQIFGKGNIGNFRNSEKYLQKFVFSWGFWNFQKFFNFQKFRIFLIFSGEFQTVQKLSWQSSVLLKITEISVIPFFGSVHITRYECFSFLSSHFISECMTKTNHIWFKRGENVLSAEKEIIVQHMFIEEIWKLTLCAITFASYVMYNRKPSLEFQRWLIISSRSEGFSIGS